MLHTIFYSLITAPSGPPLNLTATVTPRTMSLVWSPPRVDDRNGIITSYTVICSLAGIVVHRSTTSETRLTVTGLEPFTNYTCSVRAVTVVGSGPAVVKNVVTEKGEYFTFSFPLPMNLCRYSSTTSCHCTSCCYASY